MLASAAAVALAHGVGPWVSASPDADALLVPGVAAVAALVGTAVGSAILVDRAGALDRHVFCFAPLRNTVVLLGAWGIGNVAVLFWSGFLWEFWAFPTIATCTVACIGSIGAAAGSFAFAAIAAGLAWRAHQEERSF